MRDRWASAAALGALGFFALVTLSMLGLVGASEQEWSRAVYVFSGVQAVAFAAAGFFFGREVHRERLAAAEQGRERARAEADAAERRGNQLARAVRGARKPDSRFDTRSRGDEAARLIELADRLFPGDRPAPPSGHKEPLPIP